MCALGELATRVVDDVRKEDRAVQRAHLEVRFALFFTFTKVRKLAEPTFDVEDDRRSSDRLHSARPDPL